MQLEGKKSAAALLIANHLMHPSARSDRVVQFQPEIAALVTAERVFVQGGDPGEPVFIRSRC
ncbi:hypothetical protein CQ13_35975 [Bradyrhizobium retamae]|uniref:Uncharacterized protein n=2 Tax=Bradyrhizobium retamae TaxID=1300035 RepID=A0A0R3MJJ2_9BRAD|nr:hypothetical protein CQ13_35975 [Bradyrhizobium retamae]